MKIKAILHTDGSGLWSNIVREITCNEMEVRNLSWDDEPYELKLYFTDKSWRIKKHGLIYTDELFLKEFRQFLKSMGAPTSAVKDVGYSEQGMQGENYVSFDVGDDFGKWWKEKLG